MKAGIRGDSAVREAIYTFRCLCYKQVAAHGYLLETDDVISNENHDGYRFGKKIRIRKGEPIPLPPGVSANSKERAICLVLTRGAKTRRQIGNRVGYSVEEIKEPLRRLVEAGIVVMEGSGSSALYSLASEHLT